VRPAPPLSRGCSTGPQQPSLSALMLIVALLTWYGAWICGPSASQSRRVPCIDVFRACELCSPGKGLFPLACFTMPTISSDVTNQKSKFISRAPAGSSIPFSRLWVVPLMSLRQGPKQPEACRHCSLLCFRSSAPPPCSGSICFFRNLVEQGSLWFALSPNLPFPPGRGGDSSRTVFI